MKFLKIGSIFLVLFIGLLLLPNEPSEESSRKTSVLFGKHAVELIEYLHNIEFQGQIVSVKNTRGSLEIIVELESPFTHRNFSTPYLKTEKKSSKITISLSSTHLKSGSKMYDHLKVGHYIKHFSGDPTISISDNSGNYLATFSPCSDSPLLVENEISNGHYGVLNKVVVDSSINSYILVETNYSGDTISTTEYNQGKMNGKIKRYSNYKGSTFLLLSGIYKQGKRDGTWKWYLNKNRLENTETYQNGIKGDN